MTTTAKLAKELAKRNRKIEKAMRQLDKLQDRAIRSLARGMKK